MIIVSDSSPLIVLSTIDKLDLLTQLFNDVILPPAVAHECTRLIHKPGARTIQEAISKFKLSIFDGQIDLQKGLSTILDDGEVEALSLANQLKVPLFIDEHKGRKAATHLGIEIVGTGGLLVMAKKSKLISTVKPILYELISKGNRMSQRLVQAILDEVDEA